MTAHSHSAPAGALDVVLHHEGREVVRYRAADGRQALLRGLKALLDAGEALHLGDTLSVVEPGEDGGAPDEPGGGRLPQVSFSAQHSS